MQEFANQVAVITGGASGIGRETAMLLAERGLTAVVVADVDVEGGEQAAIQVRERGAKALCAITDVTDEDQVVAMVHHAHEQFGRIDILLNSAGSPIRRNPFLETTLETWEACIAQNVRGSFLCAREVLRFMVERKSGTIVNMASVAAYAGGAGHSIHYAAAKGAIVSFTAGLAREFADQGVRVNALAPGIIDTPFHEKFTSPDQMSLFAAKTPMGRLGTAREAAELIAFLCSNRCGYLTGATIRLDGGMYV